MELLEDVFGERFGLRWLLPLDPTPKRVEFPLRLNSAFDYFAVLFDFDRECKKQDYVPNYRGFA